MIGKKVIKMLDWMFAKFDENFSTETKTRIEQIAIMVVIGFFFLAFLFSII